MVTQGAGGGYGDVLERDPKLVIKDLEDGLISDYVARNIYHVVYHPDTLALDEEATRKKREQEREARKRRGVPFKEFLEKWVTSEPPVEIPWYGSWGDKNIIYGGSPNIKMLPGNRTQLRWHAPHEQF